MNEWSNVEKDLIHLIQNTNTIQVNEFIAINITIDRFRKEVLKFRCALFHSLQTYYPTISYPLDKVPTLFWLF